MRLTTNSTISGNSSGNSSSRIVTSIVTTLLSLLALSCILFNSNAYCLSFGEVKLYSYLNEPLDAEVELLGTDSMDSDQIAVSLASAQEFARAGLERPFFLSLLRFEVIRSANHTFIKITSKDAIKQPYLDFLIDLAWPGGRLVRGYTLLLDPAPFNGGGVHEKRAMQDPVDASPKVAVLSSGSHQNSLTSQMGTVANGSGNSTVNSTGTQALNSAANVANVSAVANVASNNAANLPSVLPYKLAPHSKQQYSKQQFETLFDPDIKEEENSPIPPMTVVSNTSQERRATTPSRNSMQALNPPFSKQSQSQLQLQAQSQTQAQTQLQNSIPQGYEKVPSLENNAILPAMAGHSPAMAGLTSPIPAHSISNVTENAAVHPEKLLGQRSELQSRTQSASLPMPVSFNESDVYIRINSKHMLLALSMMLLIGGLVFFLRSSLRKRKAQHYTPYVPNSPYGSNMRSLAESQFTNGLGYQSPYSFTAPLNSHSGHPAQAKMEGHFSPPMDASAHRMNNNFSSNFSDSFSDSFSSKFKDNFNNQTPQTHPQIDPEVDPFAAIDSYLDELIQIKQQQVESQMSSSAKNRNQSHASPASISEVQAPFLSDRASHSASHHSGSHSPSVFAKASSNIFAQASSSSLKVPNVLSSNVAARASSASPISSNPPANNSHSMSSSLLTENLMGANSLAANPVAALPIQDLQQDFQQQQQDLHNDSDPISMEDILSSHFTAEGFASSLYLQESPPSVSAMPEPSSNINLSSEASIEPLIEPSMPINVDSSLLNHIHDMNDTAAFDVDHISSQSFEDSHQFSNGLNVSNVLNVSNESETVEISEISEIAEISELSEISEISESALHIDIPSEDHGIPDYPEPTEEYPYNDPATTSTAVQESSQEPSTQFESFLTQLDKLPPSNEVSLKLELAQNYLDMEELDNAMPLLSAVLAEGNEQEREIAQRMLKEYNLSSVV